MHQGCGYYEDGLSDAIHFELAIGRKLGVRGRWLVRRAERLESWRLARSCHGGWLPPHHFPDDDTANPRADCHAVAISKPFDRIDDRLREPHGHGGA